MSRRRAVIRRRGTGGTRIVAGMSLFALALMAMGAAACGRPAEADESEPALTPVTVTDLRTFTLPLDAYILTLDERRGIQTARATLFVRCMLRFGFTVPMPASPEALPFTANEQRYGLTDPAQAAKYGYHTPRTRAPAPPDEPVLSAAAEAVARGTDAKTETGQDVPAGGCLGEVKRLLAEGAPEVPNAKLAERLGFDTSDRSKADSRVIAAFAAWRSCMQAEGFDYPTPLDANRDPQFNTPEPSTREIAVAMADVRCKAKVDLINIWATVETAYQRRALEHNSAELATLRALLDTQIANAARILARP